MESERAARLRALEDRERAYRDPLGVLETVLKEGETEGSAGEADRKESWTTQCLRPLGLGISGAA